MKTTEHAPGCPGATSPFHSPLCTCGATTPGGPERVSDSEIAEALRLYTDHVKNGELFKAHNAVVQIVAERALHLANKAAREVASLREAARGLLAEREQAEDARALYDAIGDFCEKVGVKP